MSLKSLVQEKVGETRPRADLPYADAWDKFTKLQQGINADIRILFSVPFGGGAATFLILHLLTPKRYEGYDLLAALLAVVLAYVYLFVASFEWLFWRCPRCHNKWPGWSAKDPRCDFCGLRLFQDAP